MTLQQLRYAIGLARCRSFNEAAGQLFISQPSLSASIAELEAEMGIQLFTRTTRGTELTREGEEFLAYARQVVEQAELLEQRYLSGKSPRRIFSVSTQHYAFAVNAFVEVVKSFGEGEYEYTLRETRTHEIIEDVAALRSEIGVLYRNDFNAKVLDKLFREKSLVFSPLFTAKPHIFIAATHPLAARASVSIGDLDDWPCLSFEQGDWNSFYFSEEILSTLTHRKSITVSDRATLFNLLIGLNGYTISTGVLTEDLNGRAIVAVPLENDEEITVGTLTHRSALPSPPAQTFLESLARFCRA